VSAADAEPGASSAILRTHADAADPAISFLVIADSFRAAHRRRFHPDEWVGRAMIDRSISEVPEHWTQVVRRWRP